MVLKVGLIGNGAIARSVAAFCADRPEGLQVVGTLTRAGQDDDGAAYPVVGTLPALLGLGPNLVVECAGHSAMTAFAAAILRAGVDLVVASTGSLADETLWDAVRDAASASGARLRLPAGAVPGIDALAAARLAGLDAVRLISTKPPRAWRGTSAEARYALGDLRESTEIFSGTARAAALSFPKNANVAATVALAGIGFERTEVRLIADPAVDQNIHRLEARGAFGQMTVEVQAVPSPDNPKTSYLAALSIMRLLENETVGISI